MRALAIVVFALLLGLGSVEAQTPTGVFATMEACEASTAVYTPAFLSGHKPLGTGEHLVTLPQRQCGEMFIAGGRWAIVAQAAGTEAVEGPDGRIVRRWDCGNGMRGFIVPSPPVADATRVATPASANATASATVTVQLPEGWGTPAPRATPNLPDPSAYQVRQSGGFWCFRGAGEGAFCTALALGAGLVLKNNWPWGGDAEKVTTLPPDGKEEVTTLKPCTSLPCN